VSSIRQDWYDLLSYGAIIKSFDFFDTVEFCLIANVFALHVHQVWISSLLYEKFALFNESVIYADVQSSKSIGVDVVYLGSTLQQSCCHDISTLEKLMHQNGYMVIVFAIEHLRSETQVIHNSCFISNTREHQRRLILRILVSKELSMITHDLNDFTVLNFTRQEDRTLILVIFIVRLSSILHEQTRHFKIIL
jgi:hypothetical protein